MSEKVSSVYWFFSLSEGEHFKRLSERACDRMQMAESRLPVSRVRPLSDPNARGLIAANTEPPYLSLSSPLPSRACIVMHFD